MATTATPPTKPAKTPPPGPARPIRKLVPNGPPLLRFYRSSVTLPDVEAILREIAEDPEIDGVTKLSVSVVLDLLADEFKNYTGEPVPVPEEAPDE